jgi:hypothetical protein
MIEATLDRPLSSKWLDLALGLAQARKPPDEAKSLLEIDLRDEVANLGARRKTRSVLTHVWIDPPSSARPAIGWALENLSGDPLPWHIGALLATYPFFGSVCRIVGQEMDLHGEVSTVEVRRRIRSKWGDRSTVDVAARRNVWTLRELGVLEGPSGTSVSRRGCRLRVDGAQYAWLVHALLLTRGIEEIDVRDARIAPELFMFSLPIVVPNGYPHLERFNEGGGRSILRPRARSLEAGTASVEGQLTLPSACGD